jgi:hypothetical protein
LMTMRNKLSGILSLKWRNKCKAMTSPYLYPVIIT